MQRADFRVFTDEELANPSPIEAYADLVRITRPVLIADLVDALIAEGGEIKSFDREGIPNHWIEEGSYLLYGPIPVEKET